MTVIRVNYITSVLNIVYILEIFASGKTKLSLALFLMLQAVLLEKENLNKLAWSWSGKVAVTLH